MLGIYFVDSAQASRTKLFSTPKMAHWSHKRTRQPTTAETTKLAETPVHVEHSDVMLCLQGFSKFADAKQKLETAHPDQAKGAKRHTWHSRNAATNNIPSAKCSAKCQNRKFPDLGSPATNGPDIQWKRNLSLLTHELR